MYDSAWSKRLTPLNERTLQGEQHQSLLSQLLPLFDADVSQISNSNAVDKYSIVFATCMGGLPPEIQNAWTGKDNRRRHVAGGGKLTKYNKRKQQYKKKKKTTKKRKTRKHKKKYKKKTRKYKKKLTRKRKRKTLKRK